MGFDFPKRGFHFALVLFLLDSLPVFAFRPPQRQQPASCYSCVFAQKRKSKQPTRKKSGFGTKTTPATTPQHTTESNADPALARHNRRQKWQKQEEVPNIQTIDAEKERLKNLYGEEYQLLSELKSPPSRRLVQVSSSPLIFTIDDFIDPAMCERVQSDGSGCFDLLFPERVADLLFQGQESELDGLLFTQADSSEHSPHDLYPNGLHMDTNGQVLFRHVTCILYLNTIEKGSGGATVFPLARTLPDDPALRAAKHLLSEKISHTRSPSVATVPGALHSAQKLEGRVGSEYPDDANTETVIRIQPKAGRLLVFFSRDEFGAEDPRSWHAGDRILSEANGQVTEKRILTLFKQVDYVHPTQVQTTFESFLAPQIREQRRRLQTMAHLGVPISYGTLQ